MMAPDYSEEEAESYIIYQQAKRIAYLSKQHALITSVMASSLTLLDKMTLLYDMETMVQESTF